jgi:hypothetical protein
VGVGTMNDIFNLKFSGKTIDGKTLVGSLVTLHLPDGDEYYIHDGCPQGHSGYHYMPRYCRVIKGTIRMMGEREV